MALDIERIDVSPKDTWVQYDGTGKNCKIQNISTAKIDYTFNITSKVEIKQLAYKESIPSIVNQIVYFRTKDQNANGTIGIVTGVRTGSGLTVDDLYNSGLQAPFNRIRIVQAQKLFDNQLQYDTQPVFWDEEIISLGGASITHDPINSGADLTVSNDGEKIIRQLKEFLRYQSGNGQVIKMTFTADVNTNEIYLVLKSKTGALVDFEGWDPINEELVIPQSKWNYDKMDGNGVSGINLNLNKSQIFLPDLEWLSVGTVRCGFDIAGKFRACHLFNHANEIRGAYMSTANLPVRHLIKREGTNIIQEVGYNDGKNGLLARLVATNQTSGTLKQICTAVESEGGLEEESGFPFSGGAGATSITLASGASFIAVAQHQLLFNGIENRARYIPQQANVSSTDANILVEFIYNPVVVGGVFVPVTGTVYSSIMERNVTATALIGGNIIFSDTILASTSQGNQANSPGSNKTTLVSKLPFGIGINGDTPIPFAVRITNIDIVPTNIYYNFNWKEIR